MSIIRGKIQNTYQWISRLTVIGDWPFFEHKGKTYDKKTYKEVKLTKVPLQKWLNDHVEEKIKEANPMTDAERARTPEPSKSYEEFFDDQVKRNYFGARDWVVTKNTWNAATLAERVRVRKTIPDGSDIVKAYEILKTKMSPQAETFLAYFSEGVFWLRDRIEVGAGEK